LKNPQKNINTSEYIFKKYTFVIESKYIEKGRKINDILIDLVVNDLTNNETYSKIDL